MNRGMLALIRKDLRSVTANHRMLVTLLVVPLVLTVFLPTVAVVTLHTAPEEAADFQKLLALLQYGRVDPVPLITHRFQGLEQVETAFRLMAEKPPELVKAVVAL